MRGIHVLGFGTTAAARPSRHESFVAFANYRYLGWAALVAAASIVVYLVDRPYGTRYGGTWAGYVVHEGGIRQVVRRVAAPAAIRWTEETKRALLGVWGRWSPGRLDDRCLSHTWPAR